MFVQQRQRRDPLPARLTTLRSALDARFADLERAFVLLDGLDRCGPNVALEPEIARLGPKVKILSTSRVFALELDEFLRDWWPSGMVWCDGAGCASYEKNRLEASVYWSCRNGHENFTLCWSCYEEDKLCDSW